MTLHLYKGPNCWIVRYPKDSEESRIMEATDIPTPFLPFASLTTVLINLKRLNPDNTYTTEEN